MRQPTMFRTRLLLGASLVCLASAATPTARAQSTSAIMGALPNIPKNAIPMPGVSNATRDLGGVTLIRGQASAVARQSATQAHLNASVSLAMQAQTAARGAAAALASSVPNGLTAGGLQLAPNLKPAIQDAGGLNTYQGALAPTQTTSGGATTVDITQTTSRAVLSWTTFNIGKDTTLNFNQKANGVVQKDWVAFNRVVGQYDPATGRRDPTLAPAPSQILGHLNCDASCVVINANGVFFGGTAQVNAGSLLVSTLEFGPASIPLTRVADPSIILDRDSVRPATPADRNDAFLKSGLLSFGSSGGVNSAQISLVSVSPRGTKFDVAPEPLLEGDVRFASGSSIVIGDSGYLFATAPHVVNAGTLSATNGEVGLVAGRGGSLTIADPTMPDQADVRGLLFATAGLTDSYVLNTGVISSPRGYISLQADAGAVLQSGLLESTSSVSRNGFIDIGAVDVQLSPGSTIAITPDTNGETIPQSPDSVAAFKTSRVRIASLAPQGGLAGGIEVGANSLLYAPGGRVSIGFDPTGAAPTASRVFIDNGATIDVGGIKNFKVPASRNQVTISPAKRNELRDTPNYRTSFLNGATIYVDPRRSGVRADGVAWVGSPLVEAGSFYQNIGVTSAELLTRGGQVSFGSAEFTAKPGATVDVSGGWVTYQAGQVQTSQLVTRGGQIVDIGNADPNGDYVGLVNPFTTVNTRFGVTNKFSNGTLQGVQTVGQCSEGRDAGSLAINAPTIALDGSVYGQAYAGALQRSNAVVGTAKSTIAGDLRAMQGAPSQLPSGARLAINPPVILPGFTVATPGVTGDIQIIPSAAIPTVAADLAYGGSISLDATGALVRPTTRDPASLLPTTRHDTILLSDSALSGMGLGQLTLDTSGALNFAPGTVTTLAPGGVLDALTGRSIHVDGNVFAPSGTIALVTFATKSASSVAYQVGETGGSSFRADTPQMGSFDVVVNGTLSTRGRFVNDLAAAADAAEGGGYTSGGSISIIATPYVRTVVGAPANEATDISGSILINPGALVDVSSGASVGATGVVGTGARGGNLLLSQETTYAQLTRPNTYNFLEFTGVRINLPLTVSNPPPLALNPSTITARVSIAPGTVRSHGFSGGGAFNLTTPDFNFGNKNVATGTQLPLDFFQQSGFSAYTINVLKTNLSPNRFTNGLGGYNAVLQTDAITLGAGQDLLLTQSQFSPLLTTDQVLAFQALPTGGSVYSVLAPSVPVAAFDARPVALKFGGLVELEVAKGARVDGAAGASLTVGKLLDEGVIRLPGGSVIASETIPGIYDPTTSSRGSISVSVQGPIFVNDLSQVFYTNADGSIDENSPSVFGASLSGPKLDGTNGVFSNRDVAFSNAIALLGKLGPAEGIKVVPGGVIDVSGISLINPRAVAPNGLPIVDGRLVEGGTIASLGRTFFVSSFNQIVPLVRTAESIDALPGSTLDLSGASASYDRLNAAGMYVSTPLWSNGGTLSLEGGALPNGTLLFNAGSVSGATIRAAGGAPAATGGTLVVLDPILAQTDDPARANNVIAADAVQAAGFSTFVSEGTLTTTGPVNLTLNRAFFAQSRPFGGDVVTNDSPLFNVQIGAIGALNIAAPLIRFAGIAQSVPNNVLGTPGTATATFTASALDVQGAVIFDQSLSSVTLAATQDLRLIGVQPLNTTLNIATVSPSLNGQLLTSGDLTLSAAQVYPTTGSSFTVAASGSTSTIRIASPGGAVPATPYSASANLKILAANIEQDGVLRAPLGTLTLGSIPVPNPTPGPTLAPVTTLLHLAKGSITSVSADGLSIPYGITTDQVEYFFTPTVAAQLPAPPAALLTLNGGNVALDAGATVNLKGGGDVFAFEFVPGVGGSRDVLDRFNTDAFSSRNGFQYPDARQVYAIVPGLNQANLALTDPIYAADYGALSSASQVGRQVYLDASPGLAAGYYTLLPAHYALLPGGLRVVEQPEYGTPVPGRSTQLRDGTTVVDGYYATANTGLHDSTLRTFTVQTQATFKNASLIATTSADTVFPARAARNGLTSPRIPLDAGRLVIDAITGITADATFQTAAASGGRASATDLAGNNFLIVGTAPTTAPLPGTIVVTTGTLAALNSASLLIGGTRTDNADGTTSLVVTTNSITIANDSTTPLTAPELLFAVAGSGSSITLSDGSSVAASGAIGDMRTGNYLLDGASGAGALLRLSTGPERVARRTNVTAGLVPPPLLSVGLAHLVATSLLLDSSGDLNLASPATGAADIAAKQIAIGAGAVAFAGTAQPAGLSITPQLQTAFAKAATLTIRSPQAVSFATGSYSFGALTLDTPALALLGDPGAVTLATGALRLQNSAVQLPTCAPDCGTATLGVTASTISFGSGQIRTVGFGGGVTLTALGGVTFDGANSTYSAIQNDGSTLTNGAAGLEVGNAPLTIATPFLGDRALSLMPGQSAVLPSLALTTTGALTLTGISGVTVPTVAGTPGARIALSGDTVSITDTKVVATAGALDLRAANGIALVGAASLSTPGYSKVFGDAADPTTVSAPGGLLTLTATNGAIDLGANTRLSVGGAQGQAGELRLVAANGSVNANGVLDAAAPDGGGLFTLVTRGGFDLGKFATGAAGGFDQRIDIRTGTGDLALAAGQSLLSRIVRLTADGGADSIAGTIDTSGINGGQIALYGENGVTLAPTGKLLARASGYGATDSRQAKGGDVTIGTDGSGAITLAAGSTIDLSATRPGDRLVTDVRNGITYYRVAASDVGGTLAIRAPIVGAAGANTVNVSAAGTVTGARDVLVEAFQRFDLGAIAADPAFTGVTVANGTATLDLRQTAPGSLNFLGDTGAGTIPTFVQTFDISAAAPNLKGLGAYRADPGIELDHSGNIVLKSNWNLGAGTVDIAGAAAAGLAVVDPANGLYSIVPGKESAVFSRFTTLTYRVGGKVDGEPGVLTIRAGGDLTIGTNTTCTDPTACAGAASITDGFFAFRDQTTPEAISLAYGGGQRSFNPTLQPYCLGGTCQVNAFDNTFDPTMATTNSILIDFAGAAGPSAAAIGRTTLFAAIPYNADANTPAAGSTSGDPLGTAEVFPRLADRRAVRSFSYNLVGGADLAVNSRPSVDPMAVNAASTGKVVVKGETSYAVTPIGETGIFTNQLQINTSLASSGLVTPVAPGGFADAFGNIVSPTNGGVGTASATTITLQDPNGPLDAGSQYLVAQANAFFAAHPGQFTNEFVPGTTFDPVTGLPVQIQIQAVSTTLALAGQFLNQIAAGYGQRIANQATGDALPVSTPTVRVAQPYNFVRTRVRTGTGGISIAAAGDIDTTNGPPILRALTGLPSFLQVGGTTIYTAGTVADLSSRTIADPASGLARTISTAAYAQTSTIFNDPTATPLEDALIADLRYLDQGGSIHLSAGRDVLGLRDGAGNFRILGENLQGGRSFIGGSDQPYRIGQLSPVADIRANPQLFQTGIATLGGGDISVVAGRDVSDLTVTANTSVVTADVTGGGVTPTLALVTKGGGNVALSASRDIVSGLFDIGEGTLTARTGRDVTSTGNVAVTPASFAGGTISNALRVRLADATASLEAGGGITVRDVVSFGAGVVSNLPDLNALGFYAPVASFAARSNGSFTLESFGEEVPGTSQLLAPVAVLPGSLDVASLMGDINLSPTGRPYSLFLSPSSVGRLRVLAGANLTPITINMDDSDPGTLPGYFSTFVQDSTLISFARRFPYPTVLSSTSDTTRRSYHNAFGATHAGDAEPARIAVGGTIDSLILNTPKQTRVSAGQDILNSAVFAQNLLASDITRVVAGRDIVATNAIGQAGAYTTGGASGTPISGNPLPYAQGNTFVIGGPGAFYLEAGRDAGPFLTSVTANAGNGNNTLGGGVLSVDNEWNPYLAPVGANVTVQFGVGHGVNYVGFRDIYLDPANVVNLPDDQFAQTVDKYGRSNAIRSEPIYAPVLLGYVQTHAAAELLAAYGTTEVTVAQAYSVFKALSPLRQRELVQQVYYNELTQTSIPTSVSYLKYARGYRAVNLLFPPALGYTANDLSGGGSTGTVPVETGNLDLRLATIQTSRGGNIDIFGPGGRVLGGSTVRTSAQAARRLTIAEQVYSGGSLVPIAPITSIPTGYEGVLTLRGGTFHGFVDRDFLLNQSRAFTQAGGDIALWSSNGDLNAGQGPKSSANFPPVVVRVGPNGNSEVDAVGGVTGAGIAAFQPAPGTPAPDVYLIAPRGTVDAGDAGVRVAGNLFVAALAVANADNFAVGGKAFGIPSGPVVNVAATSAAGAQSAAAAQAAQATANDASRRHIDPLSRIVVDVLGYYGSSDPCDQSPRPRDCPARRK